jgi:hypothetical protein
MTEEIYGRISKLPQHQQSAKVLAFVIGGLQFLNTQRGGNPFSGVDVEDLFRAVDMLADRNTLQISPFLSSWHPMVDELERGDVDQFLKNLPHRMTYEEILKYNPRAEPPKEQFNVVAWAVRSVIAEITGKMPRGVVGYGPADLGKAVDQYTSDTLRRYTKALVGSRDGTTFRHAAARMVQALRDIAIIPNDKAAAVAYLQPILDLSRAQGALTVASLNYDNALELLASTAGVAIDVHLESPGVADGPVANLKLLKLHGSVDWELFTSEKNDSRPIPQTQVRRIDPTSQRQHKPAVVFGHANKLTAEGPFLNLLREFERKLLGSEELIVVGYSFRDAHINELITNWINGLSLRRIAVLDPRYPETPYAASLRENLSKERLRIDERPASEALAALV